MNSDHCGTNFWYCNGPCRCQLCTLAHRAYTKKLRFDKRRAMQLHYRLAELKAGSDPFAVITEAGLDKLLKAAEDSWYYSLRPYSVSPIYCIPGAEGNNETATQ